MEYLKNKNFKTRDILLSVAMQDHIIKEKKINLNLNINLRKEIFNKKKKLNKIKSLNTNDEIKKEKSNVKIKDLNYKKIINKKNVIEKNEKIMIQKNRDKYYKNLSLAQKMGIVKKPKEVLNEEEWKKIIEKSKRYFNDDCCICLEKFKLNKQIILDCGHVFHFNCFNNFEKFLNNKCPVCRNSNYQKLEIYEGAKDFINLSIVKIQSYIKAKIEENNFLNSLVTINHKSNSKLMQRKIILYKLRLYNNKLINKIKENDEKLKEYFNSVDKNKIKTEQLIKNYEQNVINIANNKLKNVKDNINKKKIENFFQNKINELDNKDKKFWLKLLKKSIKRSDGKCTICLNIFENKQICLLSCSHLFHANCFIFYEQYKENKNLKCPNCRSFYSKLLI